MHERECESVCEMSNSVLVSATDLITLVDFVGDSLSSSVSDFDFAACDQMNVVHSRA